MTRHFVTIDQLSDDGLSLIYDLATSTFDDETMKGQGVALIFEWPSLRTRAASSSAVHELGGYATFFGDDEIGLDSRESAEDVGRTIAEMYAIAALRVRRHGVFARMREATSDRLSLINLLSDVAHPTQAVADVLTIADEFTEGDVSALSGLEVAYVGLLRLGVNVTVGSPEGYQLTPGGEEDPSVVDGPGTLRLCDSAYDAVKDANVVYTDAWVSMGCEEETATRRAELTAFQVNEALMGVAKKDAILMHCLPAHRGDEITHEVLDSERSRVWRQVFHRRSAMIGVVRWIKGDS
jgi:ornithine carbamoyltransferase